MPDNTLIIRIEGDASGATASFTLTEEQLKKLKAGLDEVGAAGKSSGANIAVGAKAADYSMMEARHSTMLLGESVGIHLPRAVSTMIASFAPVGAVLAAAFPIIAVAAMIAIIGTLINKHMELANAVRHSGEEIENSRIKDEDLLVTLHSANLALADQISKLEGGPAKNAMAIAMDEIKVKTDELASAFASDFAKMDKVLEGQQTFWQGLKRNATEFLALLDEIGGGDEGTFTTKVGQNYAYEQSLKQVTAAEDNLNKKRQEQADIDPTKNYDAWRLAVGATATAAGQLAMQLDGAYAAAKTAGAGREELNKIAEGASHAKTEARAMAEELTNASERRKKVEVEATVEALAAHEKRVAAAKKEFDAIQGLINEIDKLHMTEMKQREESEKEIGKEQEKALMGLNKATLDYIKTLHSLAAARAAGEAVTREAGYDAEINKIKEQAAAKVITAKEEAEQLNAVYEKERTDQLARLQQQLADQQAAAGVEQAQLTALMNSNVDHDSQEYAARLMELKTFLAQKQALIANTETQIASTNKKYDDEEARADEESLSKQAAARKKYEDQFNSMFANSVTQVLSGHETMKQAALRMYQEMTLALIKHYIMKELKRVEDTIMDKLHLAQTTAAHAASAAANKAISATEGTANAGVAATSAASEAGIAAPAVAAETFAAVEPFAFMERGGMSEGGMTLMHPREAVLNPVQTANFQRMTEGPVGHTITFSPIINTTNWNTAQHMPEIMNEFSSRLQMMGVRL